MSSTATWCTPTGNNSLVAVTLGAADHVNHHVLVDNLFDLAFQLCGRPLLDTSLGLNPQLGALRPPLQCAACSQCRLLLLSDLFRSGASVRTGTRIPSNLFVANGLQVLRMLSGDHQVWISWCSTDPSDHRTCAQHRCPSRPRCS